MTTEYDRQILKLFKVYHEGRDLLNNPVLRLAMWIDYRVKFQTETRQTCGGKYSILNSNSDFWHEIEGGKDPVYFMDEEPTDLAVLLAYELLVSLEQGRIQALYALYKAYKKGVPVSDFKDEWFLLGNPIPLSVFNWESHPEGIYALTMYYDPDFGVKAKRMMEDE